MTIRIYTSEDAGAPQLSTINDGAFAIILKACLVTGYGSKVAAGWTAEFEAAGQIALKMGVAGTGQILVVDDTYDYRYANVFACDTFTDMNTVTEKYPLYVATTGYDNWWYKRYSSSATYGKWVIIASDTFVYYLNNSQTANYQTNQFFGDYDCVEPTWEFRTAISGREIDLASVGSSIQNVLRQALLPTTDQYTYRHLRRGYTGLKQPNVGIYNHRDAGLATGNGINPLSGKMYFEEWRIYDNVTRMGKLPGVYWLEFSRNGAEEFFPLGVSYLTSGESPTGKPMVMFGGDTDNYIGIEYDE